MPTATIQQILGRASSDPDFCRRLAADPLATAKADGYEVTDEDLRALFSAPDHVGNEQLADILRPRESHSGYKGGGLVGNAGSSLTSSAP